MQGGKFGYLRADPGGHVVELDIGVIALGFSGVG